AGAGDVGGRGGATRPLSGAKNAGAAEGQGSNKGRLLFRRPAGPRGPGGGATAEKAVNGEIRTPGRCSHGIDQAESPLRRRPRLRGASQLLMAAVAHGPISGALARA